MQNITDSWFVQGMIKATSDAWLKGWDERNGGNLTLRLDEADIAPFSADFHEKPRYITLSQLMPLLANTPFIVTGSGKFFRNVQLDPAANLGVVKIDSDGVGKVKNAGVPLVAINTTAGTAAEMTSNAVIIDSARKVKEVIIDPNIIPDIAVDDASVMLEIPASVTAATGMDALTHAVEAYVSVGAHPLTDANALEAIRLINVWLPKAVDDGHNLEAREQMAFGQYLAGMAFNSAGLGLVHALAHQPGATHNLPHGVCNAILLPIVENFNRPNAVARFARIAQAMGVETRGMSDEVASQEAINAIRTLSKRVGIPEGFSKLGVTKEDIEGWLDKALADPCAPCNPRTASRDEVRELYLEAL